MTNPKRTVLIIVLFLQTTSAVMGQLDSLTKYKDLLALDSITQVHFNQSNYHRGDSLLAITLTRTRNYFGPGHGFYAYFLNRRGNSLLDQGLLQKAIESYEEARTIYRRFPSLITSWMDNILVLGQTYVNYGQLPKAQEAMHEAEGMIDSVHKENKAFDQARIWDLKAKIHMQLYDFKQAISYQQQAVDYFKQLKGSSYDIFYPDAATNLASLLFLVQRDQEARQEIDQVKSYLQAQNNPVHPTYWKVYLTDGQISLRQQDHDRAEDSFLQALLMAKRQPNPNNLWISMIENFLGSYYQTVKKDIDRAEYYFSLSRSGLKKLGVTNDFLTARALHDLSLLHMRKGRYQQAASELAESLQLLKAEQRANFGFIAERQKEIEVKSNQEPFLSAISFAAYLKQRGEKQDTLFRQLSYDAALYLNGLLLNDARHIRQVLVSSSDTTIQRLYRKWAGLKQYVTDSLPDASVRSNRLKQEIDSLEQQIARKSPFYGTGKATSQVDWRQISKKLHPDEASIAFVRFPAFNVAPTSPDSILYAALIVRPKQVAPDLVILGSEQQLLATLTRNRQPKPLNASRGTELGSRRRSAESSQLYQFIWQPLEQSLRGVKRVYYSPGGLLHTISLASLRLPAAKKTSLQYLLDRYELRELFSTRELGIGVPRLQGSPSVSAVLVGGINYGSSPATQFAPLPGSRQEVTQISRLLPKALILKDTAADESQIKALSGHSPTILHLATHGFYRPNYTPITPASQTADNITSSVPVADPLQRSGLALAGANRVDLTNHRLAVASDGILTAYEVALLDLSRTRLVVLSACETALGDVQGAEGVYGLQRAFRLAGAEKLVVSLRSVPDWATQQLMTSFYRYLQQGKEVHLALRQAQYHLRRLNPDPTVWAAFVLIE